MQITELIFLLGGGRERWPVYFLASFDKKYLKTASFSRLASLALAKVKTILLPIVWETKRYFLVRVLVLQ